MFSKENLSESEKIGRTYEMLISQRRVRRVGYLIKVLVIGGLFYGHHYINLPVNAEKKEQLMVEVRDKMSDFMAPFVQDMIQNMVESMGTGATGANQKITPEMIRAAQEQMKNK